MHGHTCSYTYQNGRRCQNNAILKYNDVYSCHIKSHCQCFSTYEENAKKLEKDFMESTYAISPVQIINNKKDGACYYRAISKFMYDNPDYFNLDVDNYDEDLNAEQIQKDLNEYISLNTDLAVRQCYQSLGDIVLDTHRDNISSLDEYFDLYSIFAGDNDFIVEEITDKNGKKKKKKKNISDRWGSTAEQIAFSLKYGIKVNVYLLQKFDKKLLKVKEVSKRSKDIRISLYQTIDPEEEGFEKKDIELNLILEKQSGMAHYLYISG